MCAMPMSDSISSSIPTVGYAVKEFRKGHVSLKWYVHEIKFQANLDDRHASSWDLAGQPRFRTMWERYCQDVNAIM